VIIRKLNNVKLCHAILDSIYNFQKLDAFIPRFGFREVKVQKTYFLGFNLKIYKEELYNIKMFFVFFIKFIPKLYVYI
jgi:hypothetical protein